MDKIDGDGVWLFGFKIIFLGAFLSVLFSIDYLGMRITISSEAIIHFFFVVSRLRRTGKTSLFENVRLNLLNEEKVVPVVFNSFGISTKARFSSSFLQEIARSYIEKEKGDHLYK